MCVHKCNIYNIINVAYNNSKSYLILYINRVCKIACFLEIWKWKYYNRNNGERVEKLVESGLLKPADKRNTQTSYKML